MSRVLGFIILTVFCDAVHALAPLGHSVGADFSRLMDVVIDKALTPEGAVAVGAALVALYVFIRYS